MALDIHKLIAAINPDIYCSPEVKDEVKVIVKEKGYAAASEKAKPKEAQFMDFDEEAYYKNPFSFWALKNPIEKHSLTYDAFGENLEPVYFWLLDTLNSDYEDMKKIDKLVDNFIASPGSGHFSELGQKATKMQEEGMKILGAANQVIKSILNILYDLKEFKLRLQLYDDYFKSNDSAKKSSALLSLKQVWMDTVDFKRGNTSLKLMAQQFQYVTLIDAFMAADSPEALKKLDLNDRVKRILQQRVGEFFSWISESEKELRKRYEIEKTYLKGQYNTVQLYARWAKPYLEAAVKLEQRASPTAALVTAFNTVLFELILLGEAEYDPMDDVRKGDLPELFKNAKIRKYPPIIIVELKFRSIPERAGQQGYGFRGRFEAVFTSYALNQDELEILKKEIEKDNLGDVLKLIEGSTSESLAYIRDEIDLFLEENEVKEKKKVNEEDTNPFSALFSIFKKERSKEEKKDLSAGIPADSEMEKVVRNQAILKARKECRKIYDLYKKAHNMPAF